MLQCMFAVCVACCSVCCGVCCGVWCGVAVSCISADTLHHVAVYFAMCVAVFVAVWQ